MKRRMCLLTGALLTWVAVASSCGEGAGNVTGAPDAGFGGSGGRGGSAVAGGVGGASTGASGASTGAGASGGGAGIGDAGEAAGSGGGGSGGGTGGTAGDGGGAGGGTGRDSGPSDADGPVVTVDSSGAGGGAGSRNDASAGCSSRATGNACVDCCINGNLSGRRYLSTYSCVCAQCDMACKAMVCPGGDMRPQTPCITCVQDSLRTVCPSDPSWASADRSLHEFVGCLLACPDR